MASFQMPEPYLSKMTGDYHSAVTLKLYTTLLNKLAKAGWTDPQSLYDNDEAVAKWIKEDSGLNADKQRKMCVSVFYALNLGKSDVEPLAVYALNSELKKAEIKKNKAGDAEYLARFQIVD